MGFRMLGSERGRWDEKRRRGKCDTGCPRIQRTKAQMHMSFLHLCASFENAFSNQGHPVKGERGQKVLRRRGMGSRRGKKKKIKS